MRNEVDLDFRFCDFEDMTPNEITMHLDIKPIRIIIKGQKKNPENPSGTAVFKSNCWMMGSSLDKFASFEEQMNALLDILESKIELFRPLCKKYYSEFSCALFVYLENGESTPWVHLDKRYNRIVKELNIEFDVDLYILPNK
jgi:hypothetical protein